MAYILTALGQSQGQGFVESSLIEEETHMLLRYWCFTAVLFTIFANMAYGGGTLRFESDAPLTVESGEARAVSLCLDYTGTVGISGIQFKVIATAPTIHLQRIVVSKAFDPNRWGFDYNIRSSRAFATETLLVVLYSRTLSSLPAGLYHDLFTVHYKAGLLQREATSGILQIIDVASALADGLGNSAEIVADLRTLSINVEPVKSFTLEQNSPNPFNPSTVVRFKIPTAGHVNISIANALGQEVAVLIDGVMESGTSTVLFNGKDRSGNILSSGIYFCRMTAGGFADSKKMLFVK